MATVLSNQQPQHRSDRLQAPAPRAPGFSRTAARGLWAAGGVLFLGSLVDLAVLWLMQRQNAPQWEFVAIANTLDAWPRFALALGLFYAAVHIGQPRTALAYRLLGAGMILLGLTAAVLGAVIVSDYIILLRFAEHEADGLAALRSVTVKAVAVSGLNALLLVPAGILSLRRTRSDG